MKSIYKHTRKVKITITQQDIVKVNYLNQEWRKNVNHKSKEVEEMVEKFKQKKRRPECMWFAYEEISIC